MTWYTVFYIYEMPNLDNVVSDVQDEITSNHFPVVGTVCDTQEGWTIVRFTSPGDDVLEIEVHMENQMILVISIFLEEGPMVFMFHDTGT